MRDVQLAARCPLVGVVSMTKTKRKSAVDVLREYGKAIRFNWSWIDGRGVRDDLDFIADQIEGKFDPDVRELRIAVGICPKGLGFWMGEGCECDKCEKGDECK